jgi:hypothetical protein
MYKLFTAAILVSLLTGTAIASDLLQASPIQPSQVKTYKYKDNNAKVTHHVSKSLLGKYELSAAGMKYPEYARSTTLKANGKGVSHNFGKNQAPESFEWGVMVQDGQIFVDSDKGVPTTVLVFKWSNGNYGYNKLHVHNGNLALHGPYGSRLEKK